MQAMPSKNLAVSTVPLLMPYIQRRPETVGGKPFKLVSDYQPAGDQPEAIRQLIRRMIDREPVDEVLSDDQIVAELRKRDIVIARRTVAKYRESLGIASSVDRRRAKALGR